MIYNTEIKEQRSEAFRYFMKLANAHKVIEVKRVSPKRSIPQNSYLHLLIADFAMEFGYKLEEAKIVYKRCSPDIYVYHKNKIPFVRSSADLSVDEMAQSITRFKDFSRDQGHPLPDADNAEWRSLISNQMEQRREYL